MKIGGKIETYLSRVGIQHVDRHMAILFCSGCSPGRPPVGHHGDKYDNPSFSQFLSLPSLAFSLPCWFFLKLPPK